MTAQLLGICHVGIQFPLYEFAKKKCKRNEENEIPFLQLMMCGAFAKLIATGITYPHEVLRSRLQFQHDTDNNRYLNLRHAIIRIYREEGYRGFYRGLTSNLLRVVPTSAIVFGLYEEIFSFFSSQF